MTGIKDSVVTKRGIELIKYCDYHGIKSIGQLLEILIYAPVKYKTFELKGKTEIFDTPDVQGEKIQIWYDLLFNNINFANTIDKYLKYKLATEA